MDESGAWFGADEVVARWEVSVLPALWTRVCRDACASKRPAGGRGRELERNPAGWAAGGVGVWLDARRRTDRSAGCWYAGDLFSGLVRAMTVIYAWESVFADLGEFGREFVSF